MYALVAAAALVAAGVAVGVTLATRTPAPVGKTQPGVPPLALDLGLRTDPQARDLRRASQLYEGGKRDQAERLFLRYGSLEAQVGAALARWPNGSLATLQGLASEYPKSAVVQLELGLAQYWDGRVGDAAAAFRAARAAEPDSGYAVRAEGLLHPEYAPGLPPFLPSFEPPARLAKLPPAKQVAALRRAAAGGGVHERLLYGVALQRLEKPVSAERQFALAAKAAPGDPEALTAKLVGLFSKDDPSKAFSRLGPLTKRFPHAPTIRYHLGLMLVWMGQVTQAKTELRLAVADDPHGVLGREAARLLARLGAVGSPAVPNGGS
jgi:predicted Zn-dependent protease